MEQVKEGIVRSRINGLVSEMRKLAPKGLSHRNGFAQVYSELPHALSRLDKSLFNYHLGKNNPITYAVSSQRADMIVSHFELTLSVAFGSQEKVTEVHQFAIQQLMREIMKATNRTPGSIWELWDQQREGLLALTALMALYNEFSPDTTARLPRLEMALFLDAVEEWYAESLRVRNPNLLHTTPEEYDKPEEPDSQNLRGLRIAAEIAMWMILPDREILFDPSA